MMASENVDLPKMDGPSKPVELNLRSNSIGEAVSEGRKEKPVPHYLKASTGSCHDLCKFGRKHVHDMKERIPISRRAERKYFDTGNTQTGTKNSSSVNGRMFFDLKSHSPDGFSVDQEGISIASRDSRNQVKYEVLEKCIGLFPVKVKTSIPDSHTSIVYETTKRRSSLASEKKETSSKISLLKSKVKLPARHVQSSTHSSIKTSATKSTEGLIVKKETLKPKSTSKSVSTSKLPQATSKFTPKKSERLPIASLSPRSPLMRVSSFNARRHRNFNIASQLKNQHRLKTCASEEQNHDEIEEKTLYVVKMESGKKPDVSPSSKSFTASSQSISSQEDQEESNFTINGVDGATCLASNVGGNVRNQETITEKRTVKPRKDASNRCEDKDSQSLNSRSSRGKVVDIRSYTNSPRRLRFRRGRVMDETTSFKVDAIRRSFKKTSGVGGDAVEAASGPEKVVLRHQDVQDKKIVQCLLNNVIEETASKLVQSKKSKVKALVSAFESVISLQERNQHC